MRALGVDVGTVRVGVAVSDPDGLVATPLDTLGAGGDVGPDDDLEAWAQAVAGRVALVARERGCVLVVVGLPRALSGRDTAATVQARRVAEAVREQGLAVELFDERLTSVQAERVLLGAGQRRAQRRAARDRVAATLILQGWLDARRR